MFGSIGMPELIVIFVIALVVFGPRRLPELGRSLGKTIAEFKKATNDLQSTLEEEIRAEEQRTAPKTPETPAPTVASGSSSGKENAPVEKVENVENVEKVS